VIKVNKDRLSKKESKKIYVVCGLMAAPGILVVKSTDTKVHEFEMNFKPGVVINFLVNAFIVIQCIR